MLTSVCIYFGSSTRSNLVDVINTITAVSFWLNTVRGGLERLLVYGAGCRL